MSKRHHVIAIDGPAGSGKSTTAKLVAEKLGFVFLDSGAMYRAATLKVLRVGVAVSEVNKVADLIRGTEIKLGFLNDEQHIYLDGEDVTEEIRSQNVTVNVSAVSQISQVRQILVSEQQNLAQKYDLVAEGRDMTTVVFPSADLKVFLDASLNERARRRSVELRLKGVNVSEAQLEQQLKVRDEMDSTREHSPLKCAPDAIVIDTSNLTIAQQVDLVVKEAKRVLENI